MNKLFFAFTVNLVLLSAGLAQTAAPKQLTIEQIFAEGGVAGRAPETIQWSPDSTKVSFVQRDDAGERGELWYADATTGERKMLASETKLAQLAPSTSKIKDEREKDAGGGTTSPPTPGRPIPNTCSSIPRDSSGITAWIRERRCSLRRLPTRARTRNFRRTGSASLMCATQSLCASGVR